MQHALLPKQGLLKYLVKKRTSDGGIFALLEPLWVLLSDSRRLRCQAPECTNIKLRFKCCEGHRMWAAKCRLRDHNKRVSELQCRCHLQFKACNPANTVYICKCRYLSVYLVLMCIPRVINKHICVYLSMKMHSLHESDTVFILGVFIERYAGPWIISTLDLVLVGIKYTSSTWNTPTHATHVNIYAHRVKQKHTYSHICKIHACMCLIYRHSNIHLYKQKTGRLGVADRCIANQNYRQTEEHIWRLLTHIYNVCVSKGTTKVLVFDFLQFQSIFGMNYQAAACRILQNQNLDSKNI